MLGHTICGRRVQIHGDNRWPPHNPHSASGSLPPGRRNWRGLDIRRCRLSLRVQSLEQSLRPLQAPPFARLRGFHPSGPRALALVSHMRRSEALCAGDAVTFPAGTRPTSYQSLLRAMVGLAAKPALPRKAWPPQHGADFQREDACREAHRTLMGHQLGVKEWMS